MTETASNTEYLAMGAGGVVGITILAPGDANGAMKVGGFVLGAWLGQRAYMLVDDPGSIPDSFAHPFAAAEHVVKGDGSLGQTAVTAGAAYASYKGAPALYKGGKAAYGMVTGGGKTAAEDTVVEEGIGDTVLDGVVGAGESVISLVEAEPILAVLGLPFGL